MSRISTLPGGSEQGLVAASRAGDDRAFEELYARYRERIFSFILSKVHDHGRAEDIAQEVFMSALRRLRSSDQAISFKPWIYEIAKNACIDEFRRGSRAREVPLESDGEFVVDRQAAAVSAVPTPPAAVESKQRLNDLRGAFGGLSSSHHQLLVMREFEGLSYDEIGERLGMTRQMVESSLFRARRKLTEEYQELASGQRCEQIQTAIEGGRLRSVSGLGLRDRRRFARHLSHCQPCRHVALMAGVDEALVKPRSIAAKIAALLPFPLWRVPWRSGGAKAGSRAGGAHSMAGAGSTGVAQSAGSILTFGQAAATVVVVVAGAGGGLAVNSLASSGHGNAPARVNGAPRRARSSAVTGAASGAAAGPAGAARRPAILRPTGAGALSVGSRTQRASHPGSSSRRQRGSAPGAPGGGGSGSSAATDGGPNSAGSGAAGAVKKTTNGLASAANGVTKTVSGVTNTVGKTVNGVTNTAGKTVNGVTNTVGKTVNGVTNTVGTTVNGVTNTVGKTVNGVTQATGTATTPVGQAVNGATTTVGQTVNGATNTAGQAVGGATGGVTKTVGSVTSGVSKTVNGVTGASTGSTGSSSSSSTTSPASPLQQAGSILGH